MNIPQMRYICNTDYLIMKLPGVAGRNRVVVKDENGSITATDVSSEKAT